ncbi:MAG: TIGR01777 family oxidoreductase [Magnetococcus sp. WYHC-3]
MNPHDRHSPPQPPPTPEALSPREGSLLLITGGTGFIGSALVRDRLARGDSVTLWTRSPRRARALFGNRVHVVTRLEDMPPSSPVQHVIHLAGQPTLGGIWTPAYRAALVTSRVATTRALVRWMATRPPPATLISASAVGWYGHRGDTCLSEDSAPGEGFTADLCRQWEAAARDGHPASTRLCIIRLGLVLGTGGGFWLPFSRAAHMGVVPILGSGKQWLPWIHRDDVLGLIHAALTLPHAPDILNAVAPHDVRQEDFARMLRRVAGGGLSLRLPPGLLNLMPGGMSALFLDSQRVIPAAAQRLGYVFRHPRMEDALAHLWTQRSQHSP